MLLALRSGITPGGLGDQRSDLVSKNQTARPGALPSILLVWPLNTDLESKYHTYHLKDLIMFHSPLPGKVLACPGAAVPVGVFRNRACPCQVRTDMAGGSPVGLTFPELLPSLFKNKKR